MKAKETVSWHCGTVFMAIAGAAFAGVMQGCAAISPSIGQKAGGDASVDARVASPELLADKSKDETDVTARQGVIQGDQATAAFDTNTTITKTDQKGVFNTSLAIIGGGSAAGVSGVGGIALWLRWARKTSKARTDAQTLRIKMLVDLLRDVIRRAGRSS